MFVIHAIGSQRMQLKNTAERYGLIAQLLHWSIVVLIVTQFVLAEQAEDATSLLKKAQTLTLHKNIGMTIFMLAIVRLLWRWANTTPAPLPQIARWQQRIAEITHWALYALIMLTPLMGWLMSSAKSYSVSYFGWFTFPDLIAPDEGRYETLHTLHEVLAFSILNLALLHIAAALKHHFWDKDNVLRRMLPVKLRGD
jgi:cytochrome b561